MTLTVVNLTQEDHDVVVPSGHDFLSAGRIELGETSLTLVASLEDKSAKLVTLSLLQNTDDLTEPLTELALTIGEWVYSVAHNSNRAGVRLLIEPTNPLVSELNEIGFRRVQTRYTMTFVKDSDSETTRSNAAYATISAIESSQWQILLNSLNEALPNEAAQMTRESLLTNIADDLPLVHVSEDDAIDAFWCVQKTDNPDVLMSRCAWAENVEVLKDLVRHVSSVLGADNQQLIIEPGDSNQNDHAIARVLGKFATVREQGVYYTIF